MLFLFFIIRGSFRRRFRSTGSWFIFLAFFLVAAAMILLLKFDSSEERVYATQVLLVPNLLVLMFLAGGIWHKSIECIHASMYTLGCSGIWVFQGIITVIENTDENQNYIWASGGMLLLSGVLSIIPALLASALHLEEKKTVDVAGGSVPDVVDETTPLLDNTPDPAGPVPAWAHGNNQQPAFTGVKPMPVPVIFVPNPVHQVGPTGPVGANNYDDGNDQSNFNSNDPSINAANGNNASNIPRPVPVPNPVPRLNVPRPVPTNPFLTPQAFSNQTDTHQVNSNQMDAQPLNNLPRARVNPFITSGAVDFSTNRQLINQLFDNNDDNDVELRSLVNSTNSTNSNFQAHPSTSQSFIAMPLPDKPLPHQLPIGKSGL